MSRLKAPLSDDAVVERLALSLRSLEPDSLYRRRLRGAILNRYVATREGLVREASRRPRMGMVGRGVLYFSLVLVLAMGAAGSAAAASLPGDLLYPIKLQIEEARLQIAPPSMRADLLAMALNERLDELEQLAAAGQWAEVAMAAQAVTEAEARLALAAGDPRRTVIDAISQHAAVLTVLVDEAPASAQKGLQQAIEASSSSDASPAGGSSHPVHPPAVAPPTRAAGEDRELPFRKRPDPAL